MKESQFSKVLLERYRAGDELAAEEIWIRYASRLRNLTQRRIGGSLAAKSDADDILQTTFFEFFEKAKKDQVRWQQRGDLWRLLASIAIHHVGRESDRYRTAKRSLAKEQRDADFSLVVGRDDEVAEKIDELIEPLLKDDAVMAIVLLGRLAGKTLAEISNETGKSQRTLRRVLQKAKMALVADSEIQTGREVSISNDEILSARYEDYDLLKMIGAGGFGKVYLARDLVRARFVAVKALRRDWIGNATAESLFLNEAAIIARLDHPNIVRFQKAGPLPNGSWFMVLDYVKGRSLEAVELQFCDPGLVLQWMEQIASALSYLHHENVIHGDLKPANVLVGGATVRLVDFGFSCRSNSESPVWFGGTRQYAAPERQTSEAADVFAFGKVIEFLCSGMTELDHQVASHLGQLVGQACEQEPSKRPRSTDLLSRIQRMNSREVFDE